MFSGEYYSQLGEKNRVAIPKKLRDKLSTQLLLTRGFENSLILVDKKNWDLLQKELKFSSLASKDVRNLKRYLIGGMQEVEYDAQGRFVIPESLLQYAKIQERLVFVGVSEWIEVWSFETWQEQLSDIKNNLENISENLK